MQAEADIPVHPTWKVKDWDAPATACVHTSSSVNRNLADEIYSIDWPRFVKDVKAAKQGDSLKDLKRFHEHLNLLTPVPVPDSTISKWTSTFAALPSIQETTFVLIDGFLMFYNPSIYELLDVRLLIRSSKEVLHRRRSERNERIAEDSFWKDPPHTFERIVWPAYVEAHAKHFEDGDVENGHLLNGQGVVLLEERKLNMEEMLEQSCSAIQDFLEK